MNGSLLHIKRTPGTDFWNEKVANDECSLVDSPGSLSLGEFGELGDLDGGEAEEFAAHSRTWRLVVIDSAHAFPHPLHEGDRIGKVGSPAIPKSSDRRPCVPNRSPSERPAPSPAWCA